jgi:hypothetical protein
MFFFDKYKFLREFLETTDKEKLLVLKNAYSCYPESSLTKCYDLEEIVFNELNENEQGRVLSHIAKYGYTIPEERGLHVMTDIDDTLFSSRYGGSDVKFENKTFYPGLKSLYRDTLGVSFLTLLSARPKLLELPSRVTISQSLDIKVNMLSGDIHDLLGQRALVDESNDTVFHCHKTSLEDNFGVCGGGGGGGGARTYEWATPSKQKWPESVLDLQHELTLYRSVPTNFGTQKYPTTMNHISGVEMTEWYRNYRDMGVTKFQSIRRFVLLYPEYKIVFIGDSGQGDLICAYLLSLEMRCNPDFPLVCSYIHNILKESQFKQLEKDYWLTKPLRDYLMISESLEQELSKCGIYMFSNYVEVVKHTHDVLGLIEKKKVDDFVYLSCAEFDMDTQNYVYNGSNRLRKLLREDLKY